MIKVFIEASEASKARNPYLHPFSPENEKLISWISFILTQNEVWIFVEKHFIVH